LEITTLGPRIVLISFEQIVPSNGLDVEIYQRAGKRELPADPDLNDSMRMIDSDPKSWERMTVSRGPHNLKSSFTAYRLRIQGTPAMQMKTYVVRLLISSGSKTTVQIPYLWGFGFSDGQDSDDDIVGVGEFY